MITQLLGCHTDETPGKHTHAMMDVLLIRSFIKLSVASRAVIHGFPRESLSSMRGCTVFPACTDHS